MVFALIGNQNSGKTTLFNQLTGSNAHVGNFPGVTVEKKEGKIRAHPSALLVDLPGIYSLTPYSAEEVVTRDFLTVKPPDGVINIIDATNIERNLYLTLQLLEMEIPVILALNMMDEVRKNGGSIDIAKLSEQLGIPVVPISASRNEGVDELIERAIAMVGEGLRPKRLDFCTGEVHKAIHAAAHIIESHAKSAGVPLRFAATSLIAGDPALADRLQLSDSERDILERIAKDMEMEIGSDRVAALVDMRYSYIESLCREVALRVGTSIEQERSLKIDRVLTHRVFAIPIFLLIMMLVFYLTFGTIGSFLSGLMENAIDGLTMLVDGGLAMLQVNPAVHSLIIDGVFAGVGSVLSFLPTIVVLFFFLSMLEDSGYMARVAFVMDRMLRKIGLSGRSFVPMLIGFGCSVPAIMATRTLSSERDRKMTILLTPFMSCSAKLPIYSVLCKAFFPDRAALVMIALYVMGMVVAVLYGLALKSTFFKGNPIPFVMELPAYRLPSPKSVALHMWEKAKDFLRKAFTIIFIATIAIWVLQSFDFRLMMVQDSANSMLASLSRLVTPIFRPLGLNDWRISAALITGLTAKEAVVSTLGVLYNVSVSVPLEEALRSALTPLSAFSFLTFSLLYMPCVAAFAAIRRELGSLRQATLAMLYQTAVAWIVACAIYWAGSLMVG